jgi:tetratricopeptide (TPR) repeat protein
LKTALGTAEILHHGYTKEMVRDRNKIERNLKLLRAAVQENPADVNLVMNFGLELVRSDDLAGGIEKYREAYEMMSAQPVADLVPELREVLLTQFTSQLYKVRGHEEVVSVLNSPLARRGGLTSSLHFALGLAHFELKQFSEAADQMRQCLTKRQQSGLTPINTDILTAAPSHCLALCLAKLGDPAGAEKAFATALAETGHVPAAKLDYAKFLQQQNRLVEALQRLHEIVGQDARHVVAWRLGAEIALAKPEFLEFARDWTGEAFKALPENPAIAAQRAEALMLNGDPATAAGLWEKIWRSEPEPRTLAALILCETVGAQTTHAPTTGSDEQAASRAFIEWYQRLIAVGTKPLIGQLNGRLDKLSRALPTAAEMLATALSEADVPAGV